MQYRKLGRTDLMVSEIGFGAWAIGGHGWGPSDDNESLEALKKAFELGINFVDTADVYGAGHSEELIAKAANGIRDKVIIATKFGNDFYGMMERKYPLRANFSAEYTTFAVEQSLKRLGTDHIDLIQLHATREPGAGQTEAFEALDKLKQQGKVRFIGVSVKSVEDGIACVKSGRADTIQTVYNMIRQEASEEFFLLAEEAGVGIIAREPLSSGLLTGKWTPEWQFHERDFRRYRFRGEGLKKGLQVVEKLNFLLQTGSKSMAQAALRFVLSHPAVSVVIPGCRTPQQVVANVSASDAGPLSEEDLSRIKELSEHGFHVK